MCSRRLQRLDPTLWRRTRTWRRHPGAHKTAGPRRRSLAGSARGLRGPLTHHVSRISPPPARPGHEAEEDTQKDCHCGEAVFAVHRVALFCAVGALRRGCQANAALACSSPAQEGEDSQPRYLYRCPCRTGDTPRAIWCAHNGQTHGLPRHPACLHSWPTFPHNMTGIGLRLMLSLSTVKAPPDLVARQDQAGLHGDADTSYQPC